MDWPYVMTVLAAVLLGFLAGLLTFKVKQKWCPECGGELRCVACLDRMALTGRTTRSQAR